MNVFHERLVFAAGNWLLIHCLGGSEYRGRYCNVMELHLEALEVHLQIDERPRFERFDIPVAWRRSRPVAIEKMLGSLQAFRPLSWSIREFLPRLRNLHPGPKRSSCCPKGTIACAGIAVVQGFSE
jgi:hypothetical protein